MNNKSPQLLKYVKWQSGSGRWYCNDTSDLSSVRAEWWIPAKIILNLTLDNYVKLLIDNFKVNYISFDGKTLVYSWDNEKDCAKFVNYINAEARKKKIII